MWPDIEFVPAMRRDSSLLDMFPKTKDRLDATWYLISGARGSAGNHLAESERNRIESWLNWAGIAALACVSESLEIDLEDTNLKLTWNEAAERIKFEADPLLSVFKELRNFGVHIEFHPICSKTMSYRWGNLEKSEPAPDREHFYFQNIEWSEFSTLRNIRRGASNVKPAMVDWFNRQAQQWPASYLIGKARETAIDYLEEFVIRSGLGTDT